MITPAAGVRIWLAAGLTDMRRGFDGLAALVQQHLGQDPFSGHLFVFRGKRGHLLKILFWDGNGLCLFTKRLQHGRFIWPSLREPGGTVTLTPAQLAMLSMLMPLLVRLTDSEVEAIDGVVPQVSDCLEDGSGVLEEVSSSRLSIDEKALLPDLHVDPVHGDI